MIQFRIRDRDAPDYDIKASNQVAGGFPSRLITRRGTEFDMDGNTVELFTVGVLAEAMDRTNQCLLKWEKEEKFPKPMFTTDAKKRWYSKVQVTNLHNLVWGKYKCRKNHTVDLDKFFQDVRAVFYDENVVVGEDGKSIRKGRR